MQLFEVTLLDEPPYMETREIIDGESVGAVIKEDSVYLMVDHDAKRILTYHGSESSLKHQFYGGLLARELRKQLRLFYRIFHLNEHDKESEFVQEVMSKPIGPGRAKAIPKEDLSQLDANISQDVDLSVHPGLNVNRAIDLLNDLPSIENFERKLLIIGANVYNEERIPEKSVQEEKDAVKPVKMGRVNRGFTFFKGENYSTRILIKERKVQGIELLAPKEAEREQEVLEPEIPLFYEEKFRTVGKFEDIENAFDIPESLPDVDAPPDQEQE
ncbi:MAG: hypothetical protein EU544_03875 [Promethearchaeota archaeon]|nr:MAG: hypothetical protein EU544_03875 [Candidatus Lokiarchaeota archaeon]